MNIWPTTDSPCEYSSFCNDIFPTLHTRWNTHFPEDCEGKLVGQACLKLTTGDPFNSNNTNYVFDVLSVCLCLNLVVFGSEAFRLADCSVAHHMRLLTGFSTHSEMISTCSLSELILALGSAKLLYRQPNYLAGSLETCHSPLQNRACRKGYFR